MKNIRSSITGSYKRIENSNERISYLSITGNCLREATYLAEPALGFISGRKRKGDSVQKRFLASKLNIPTVSAGEWVWSSLDKLIYRSVCSCKFYFCYWSNDLILWELKSIFLEIIFRAWPHFGDGSLFSKLRTVKILWLWRTWVIVTKKSNARPLEVSQSLIALDNENKTCEHPQLVGSLLSLAVFVFNWLLKHRKTIDAEKQ